jgi:hypothetical protein
MVRGPQLSTHALEQCFLRNPHFIFCSSFLSLRLGWGKQGELVVIRDVLTGVHAIRVKVKGVHAVRVKGRACEPC